MTTKTSKPERWAVVGGGLLGLTLAHRLALLGKRVTLFEGAAELGGLASAWSLDGVVWDRHYHVTLLSDLALRSLLAELGLEDEMKWVETRTGFYTDGRLYSLSNTLEFLRFPPLDLISKLRLGATIFYASKIKDWKRLEKIYVADWLRRLSGRRTLESIWLPLLRAKLGANYQQTSAAFIWATIARMYAARRTGLKKEMFGYLPGGYARLLARFAAALTEQGVKLKLGRAAKTVETMPGGGVSVAFENGMRESFDQAVLTVAAPLAVQLCPGLSAEEKAKLRAIRYQGIVCASALLKQPLAGFYVTNITDSWVPFTAVIEMSALADRAHFGGNTLVYLPKYLAADDPFFCVPDEEVKEQFVAALLRMYPHLERGDLLSFRLSRARYVHALSTLNYSEHLPPVATSVPGIHIVNSAHIVNGTLNVNETIQLAERTVKRLVTPLRHATTIAPSQQNETEYASKAALG